MCAPMHIKSEEVMYEGVLSYARNYKNSKENSRSRLKRK